MAKLASWVAMQVAAKLVSPVAMQVVVMQAEARMVATTIGYDMNEARGYTNRDISPDSLLTHVHLLLHLLTLLLLRPD